MASDTETAESVAPDGLLAEDIIRAAEAYNPFSGNVKEPVEAPAPPGTPQLVESQSDRLAKAGDKAPTTSLATQEEIEASNAAARSEWLEAALHPSTLSTQADNLSDFQHAADFTPGGRFSDEAKVDYFPEGRATHDPISEAVQKEREEAQAAEEEARAQAEEQAAADKAAEEERAAQAQREAEAANATPAPSPADSETPPE